MKMWCLKVDVKDSMNRKNETKCSNLHSYNVCIYFKIHVNIIFHLFCLIKDKVFY